MVSRTREKIPEKKSKRGKKRERKEGQGEKALVKGT